MSQMTDADLIDRLIDFATNFKSADIDSAARHEALRSFVDSVACILAGGKHALTRNATQSLSPFFGAGYITLLGQGLRADLLHAALINGTSGAAYSFFDNYSHAHLHLGGSLAAVMLAVSEHRPQRGAELLDAFTIGMEIGCRITKAIALAPADTDLGWSMGGIVNGMACALAAGRLLKLPKEQMLAAFNIAATQAAGLRVAHGSMTTSLVYGHSAQIGIRAAIMAAGGFTASANSFYGKYGFTDLFTNQTNLPSLVENLGQKWLLHGLSYKPFPTDIVCHAAIQAVIELKEAHKFDGAEIASIRIEASESATALGNRPTPKDDIEAKFSMHHWVAAAALYGKASIAQGRTEVVLNPDVLRIRGTIELAIDPIFAWDGSRVILTLADGRVLSRQIDHCSGSAENPMSDAQITSKALALAETVLGAAAGKDFVEMCWDLDRLPDAAKIAKSGA